MERWARMIHAAPHGRIVELATLPGVKQIVSVRARDSGLPGVGGGYGECWMGE
jgi:hypothetical protein